MNHRSCTFLGVSVVLTALLFTGCDNMKHQPYLRRDEPSARLPSGSSTQSPPPHTVAHQPTLEDAVFLTGERKGALVDELPVKLTPELLARGRERYTIYCAVCHGPDGYGQGIIVRRGFPAPPSYHDARLRNAPIGHFFRVMTRGFGAMYPYADRLTPQDRWAVAAYIRALQLSQYAPVEGLPPPDREKLAGQ